MKLLIAVIVLAIVAGGVWLTQSGNNAVVTDQVIQTDAGGVALEAEESSALPPETVVKTDVTPAEAAESLVEMNTPSPFSSVEESSLVAESQIVEPGSTESQAVSGDEATIAIGRSVAEENDKEAIVVPQSYPISDAAKYFIPKEERGPGRLGGPPPLDFPGGPNDPNNEGGSAESIFSPPASPGN